MSSVVTLARAAGALLVCALALCACPGDAPRRRDAGPSQIDLPVGPRFDGLGPPRDLAAPRDVLAPPQDSAAPPPPDAGPSGCAGDEQSFNNKCYRVISGFDMSYSAAKQACAQRGGAAVVAIETSGEDTFVYNMLPATTSAVWLGLVRQGGGFVWESSGVAPGYTNWASGEPNNDSGNESCVVMWGPALTFPALRSKWNDAPCDGAPRDAVVCER